MSLMIDALNSINFSIENKTSTYENSHGIAVPRIQSKSQESKN